MKRLTALVLTAALLLTTMVSVSAKSFAKPDGGTEEFSDSYIEKLTEYFGIIEDFSAGDKFEKSGMLNAVGDMILNNPINGLGEYEGEEGVYIENPRKITNVCYKIKAEEFEWYTENVFNMAVQRVYVSGGDFYYYDGYYYGYYTDRRRYSQTQFDIDVMYRLNEDILYLEYSYVSPYDGKKENRYAIVKEKYYNGELYFGIQKIATRGMTEADRQEALPDAIIVTVNGNKVTFDQIPVIQDGRTLVPIRAVFETLGCEVEWDNAEQKITISRKQTSVICKIGSTSYDIYKDGKLWGKGEFEVPPQIINSRTLVPVRTVCEVFGCTVKWDNSTRTVIITY